MKSLNRVMLIGHLAADVDFRKTKTGISVANFPVAINRMVRSEMGSVKKEVTDYHRIVVWGKLAEICNKYLAKGLAVFVDGRLVNSSYDDKAGVRHYKTEVVADMLNILTWGKTKAGGKQVVIEPVSENEDVDVEVVENGGV